jgi:UDP-hydrolysing UDP-N-acetyl-D-glucosamine 2-epimerase
MSNLNKRKICVVTGSRAEYGLLYWLMKEIKSDAELELQIIATGMHLSPEFGLTYKQIEFDGFKINWKVEMLLSSDTSVGISKSIGIGIIGFADALNLLKPDIMVVLGDRFEILAAAQAALISKIPIAHVSGGETTEGAYDESIRHAITKMSHLHFVTAEPYRKRVIQLGENPDSVFNFGAPGLDHINYLQLLKRDEISERLKMKFGKLLFLVTYHPVTLSDIDQILPMNELLSALSEFPEATIVFTYPNADSGGRELISILDKWVSENLHRAGAFVSLGQQLYLSVMKEADVVIGNSSSGLTEAPALMKATVNIGDRQKGRLKAVSVIDVRESKEEIADAIRKAISKEFSSSIYSAKLLHGFGNVGLKIKNQLKVASLKVQKPFYDLS